MMVCLFNVLKKNINCNLIEYFLGILLYYLWKRIGSLIGLTCKDDLDESDPSNDQEFNKKWINNDNNQQMNNNLIEHYLNNSIQIILNANLQTNSKLNNEYVNIFKKRY